MIRVWFDGFRVTAYWDPYMGGYYYYDPDFGYTPVY
jgi:hypothetical protein